MARYRIVQRASHLYPSEARYDLQEKIFLFWETIDFGYLSVEGAREAISKIRAAGKQPRVKRKIIQEYD